MNTGDIEQEAPINAPRIEETKKTESPATKKTSPFKSNKKPSPIRLQETVEQSVTTQKRSGSKLLKVKFPSSMKKKDSPEKNDKDTVVQDHKPKESKVEK